MFSLPPPPHTPKCKQYSTRTSFACALSDGRRLTTVAFLVSALFTGAHAETFEVEDLAKFYEDNSGYSDLSLTEDSTISLSEGIHSVNYADDLVFSLYTRYGPHAIVFQGATNGGTTITAADSQQEESLLEFKQTQGSLVLSDLTLDGANSAGNAILFTQTSDPSYDLDGTLKNVVIKNFDNSKRTNRGQFALIQGNPALYSGNTVRYWFSNLTFSNVTFEENRDNENGNTGLFDLYAQNAVLDGLKINDNHYDGSALGLLSAGNASLSNITAQGNTSSNSILSLSLNSESYIDRTATGYGEFSLSEASFTDNQSASGSIVSIGNFTKATLEESVFSNNTAKSDIILLSSNAERKIRNVLLQNNHGETGINLYTLNRYAGQQQSVVIENLQANGNDVTSLISVNGEIELTQFDVDLTLRMTQETDWNNADADYAVDVQMTNGSELQLKIDAEADFSTDKGIRTAKARWANGSGTASITKNGSARWTLGGHSDFAVDTAFNVAAGTLELTPDARLAWSEDVDTSKNAFTVQSNAALNVTLHDVSALDAAAHGALAPLSLAGHGLSFAEGSSLHVSIADFESVSNGDSGWLILAENARLDTMAAPDLTFADEENWLFRLTGDGLGLQQGVSENGEVKAGTEENVYIGYELEDTLHPDEGASTLVSATSHFALSSMRQIAGGFFFYRPTTNDSLWARPEYLHDRRTPDGSVGFDAQLRGITVGKDFRTENGFWGVALGHGNGRIHSLGAADYTNGEVKSTWAALYGERRKDAFVMTGTLAYLYQKADQDQSNMVGELHTATKNDVIWADFSIGREALIDSDAKSSTTVTPSIGLQYAWLRQRDFNVDLGDAGGILKGEAESMHIASVPVDVALAHDWAGSGTSRHHFEWKIGGSWTFTDRDMSGHFEDFRGKKADEWTLVPLDRWQAETSLAYTLYDSESNMTLTLGGAYVYGENRELAGLNAVVRWIW